MTTPEPCRHWWLIGDRIPGQARDKGRCKSCGAVKTFPTMYVDKGYDDLRVQRPSYFASERDIVGYMADRQREI